MENYDIKLTEEVKKRAKELGACLVGIASIDRFENAPSLHKPTAFLPAGKSVVVFATFWADASMELTEKEISEHWYNPYDIAEGVGGMAHRLNILPFVLSRFLEEKRYASLPFPQTCYWRWRPYKSMKDPFAPPLAHRYAAVAAGLGEIGWHNSFMSPQYGPRQRLSSLVTEAPLKPDPLYNGEPLCDKCMLCVKACPYERFTKEVEGIVELDIGGKKITIPRTNKWRCHLCYYQINPRFLPEKITEKVAIRIENDQRAPNNFIMDSAACITACLPPHLRKKDRNLYPNTVKRKREKKFVGGEEVIEKLKKMVESAGMDFLYIGGKEEFEEKGINLDDYMPGSSSVVLFGKKYDDKFMSDASSMKLRDLGYDIQRLLQEDYGYYTLPLSRLSAEMEQMAKVFKINEKTNYYHLITEIPIGRLRIEFKKSYYKKKKLSSDEIKEYALKRGADLAGISSVKRVERIASLYQSQAGEETINAENKTEISITGGNDMNFSAKNIEKVKMKKAKSYLKEAQSIIVIGLHYPYALSERVAKPPSENVGPYSSYVYQVTNQQLQYVTFDIINFLKTKGYKAVATFDLEGNNWPRHSHNRFSAVGAGLGEIGWCGHVLTSEFGYAQRFVSIITDAELEEDKPYCGKKLCRECFTCIEKCPVNAISKTEKIKIEIDGKTFKFGKRDRLKCEWANRFGLVGEEGPKYMGCKINILPPEKITLKSFEKAVKETKKLDMVERLNWNLTFEKCTTSCPVKGNRRG